MNVERFLPLVLAILAVFALATIASTVDRVSTEPTIDSNATPMEEETHGGGPLGTATPEQERTQQAASTEATASRNVDSQDDIPLHVVAAGLAVFVVGSTIVLYGLTRGDADRGGSEDQPPAEPTAPAADHVTLGESVPLTNDVYRAWAALCRAIPEDPTGQTPASVAQAAVDAGHEPAAVTELTDLFCVIRYGGAVPSPERERRAIELARTLDLPLEVDQ